MGPGLSRVLGAGSLRARPVQSLFCPRTPPSCLKASASVCKGGPECCVWVLLRGRAGHGHGLSAHPAPDLGVTSSGPAHSYKKETDSRKGPIHRCSDLQGPCRDMSRTTAEANHGPELLRTRPRPSSSGSAYQPCETGRTGVSEEARSSAGLCSPGRRSSGFSRPQAVRASTLPIAHLSAPHPGHTAVLRPPVTRLLAYGHNLIVFLQGQPL